MNLTGFSSGHHSLGERSLLGQLSSDQRPSHRASPETRGIERGSCSERIVKSTRRSVSQTLGVLDRLISGLGLPSR